MRLSKLLIRARRFNAALAGSDGVMFAALARRDGVSPSYFTRLVRLSYLAPDITQAILNGRQPRGLTACTCVCRWLGTGSESCWVLLEPISALSFIDIAEARAGQPRLATVPRLREPHRRQSGTGISPDRDTTAPQRDVAGPCASLSTAPLAQPAHPRETAASRRRKANSRERQVRT